MADIGPSTDNATLAEILANVTNDSAFQLLNVDHQDAIVEAEGRIRELPDEED